ncbi:MAG: response regulator [Microthrixaceae bacterium]
MASVVICDDDRVTRGAVSALCEDLGIDVVAETDQWIGALELSRRFHVDILVLDLMLADGSAEQTLENLMLDESGPRVVVFSSYADDPERLIRLGATEVVQKPDFQALSVALGRIASGTAPLLPAHERTNRRLRSREPDPLPEVRRSSTGVAAATDLRVSLIRLIEGDSVLVVSVVDDAPGVAPDPVVSVQARATVGELLARTVRAQDVVHESPEVDGHVALLRGGDERSGAATFRRLVDLANEAHVPGRLLAVDRRVDAMGGADAVARAIGALLSREGLLSAL